MNVYKLHEVFDYDTIFNIFYKVMNTSDKELLVNLSVLLQIVAGKLKIDIKNKNYENVSKNIFRVMEFFTNNTNKRIDNDIFKYYNYIFTSMTVKDFLKIFKDPNHDKFSFFDFDSDFVLKLLNIISNNFSLKTGFLLESEKRDKIFLDELIDSYLSNNIQLVKNINTLKNSLVSLFHFNKFIMYDFRNFDFTFDDQRATNYLRKFVSMSKQIEIKEMKQLCTHLVFMYKKFFIFHQKHSISHFSSKLGFDLRK